MCVNENGYPVISMDTLDTLKYGKDYTQENGLIILTNGKKYAIPRFTGDNQVRKSMKEWDEYYKKKKQEPLPVVVVEKNGKTSSIDLEEVLGDRHDKPCPTSQYVWDHLI